MNYLAHALFSFNNPAWLVGNMISDFVKGKKQYDYPADIQTGIRLHRLIDQFTDNDAATALAKNYFRPHYRLYAGAFVDVTYDYFLANDPRLFANEEALADFASQTYLLLENNYEWLPDIFKRMFDNMRKHNWLYNYRYRWGLEKSYGGVVYRSAYLTESAMAFQVFDEHYESLHTCYHAFVPRLQNRLEQWMAELDTGLSGDGIL